MLQKVIPAPTRLRYSRGKRGKHLPSIEISLTLGSWTSVVTGAVRCELMSLGNIEIVNTRLSRWNYGFRYNMRFDPYNDDHQIDQVYDCEIEKGVKKARQVAWVVRKVCISL